MVKKTLALGREVIDELISTTLPPLPEPRDMNIAPTFNKDEQPSVNEMPQDFVAAVKNYEEMYRSIMLNPIVPKAEKAILELQHREVEKEVSVFNADQNISQSS